MPSNENLKKYFDRLKNLDDEKKSLNEDISELMKEAKAENLDPKTLRKLLSRRRKSKVEIEQEESLISEYEAVLGE